MTQEEKELLLKDLCGRLPYGVNIQCYYEEMSGSGYFDETLWSVDNDEPFHVNHDRWIEDIKPYLRPMSSMTEEDVQEIRDRLNNISIGRTITKENFEKCGDFLWFTKMSSFECVSEKMMDVVISYLDKNMFDYRGLIPLGLALPAKEGMYK